MLYALARLGQKYFQQRLDRFIALAPCWVNPADEAITVEDVQGFYEACQAVGVHTIGGDNAAENIEKVCSLGDEHLCNVYKSYCGFNPEKRIQKYHQTVTIQN